MFPNTKGLNIYSDMRNNLDSSLTSFPLNIFSSMADMPLQEVGAAGGLRASYDIRGTMRL